MGSRVVKDGEWVTSTTDEAWPWVDQGYPTKEAAIAAAAEEHDLDPGDVFYVGQAHNFTAAELAGSMVDVERMLEASVDYMTQECGDAGEDGVQCSSDDETDLQARLEAVVIAWLTERKLIPEAFCIANDESHRVPEAT